MLSRVASHAYWLGRYLERAEDLARTMHVHDHMLIDVSEVDRVPTWYQFITINNNETLFSETFDQTTEQNIVRFLILSEENPSSIVSTLNGVRYNLRACRSIIPKAMYELINQTCLLAADVSEDNISHARRRAFLRNIEQHLLAISGAATGSMSYNKTFLFMRLGCFLERADMTSRILDVRSADLLNVPNTEALSPYENTQWIAVLQSLQAFQMYMAEVRGPIYGPDVLNFVLKNLEHPKSYRFCIERLASFIRRLPDTEDLQTHVSELLDKVDEANVRQLARNQVKLHEFMDSLQMALADIGDGISAYIFSAKEPVPAQSQTQSQASTTTQGQKQ